MGAGKDTSQLSAHAEPALLQIDFYHLRNGDLATPLSMLAHKTVASGHKLLILAQKDSHEAISERLWTFRADSFLAHAADENEGHKYAQIWLTSDVAANQIDARFLALTAGLEPPQIQKFDRVFNLFDGTSEVAVSAARDSWKRWSETEDVTCRYFAQDDQGRWSLKK
tara:strand:+ start:299 stop:802 length:504 start_codon:yes stop_codon:yes gene_type:complete